MVIKILLAFLLLCSLAVAQQTSKEKAVWQLEEDYWRILHDGQQTAYLALWDESFFGWPVFENNPVGKKDIAARFAPVSHYKLVPLSVREYGNDIVFTFYRAEIIRNGETRTGRLTHTWKRRKSGWLIIGGMSADDAPSPK